MHNYMHVHNMQIYLTKIFSEGLSQVCNMIDNYGCSTTSLFCSQLPVHVTTKQQFY